MTARFMSDNILKMTIPEYHYSKSVAGSVEADDISFINPTKLLYQSVVIFRELKEFIEKR